MSLLSDFIDEERETWERGDAHDKVGQLVVWGLVFITIGGCGILAFVVALAGIM